jgi:hypothetical protein
MDYDMYMEILNRLDTLNTKIDICCGNYDKASENIQRTYRGFTSRRNTRRTMKPNITESLLNMPGDISQMITDRVNELKPKETIGWTIFKNSQKEQNGWNIRGSLKDIKKRVIENNTGGFIRWFGNHNKTIDHGAAIIENNNSNPDELILNIFIHKDSLKKNHRGWHPEIWISPGASLELIKQKINEGFEVEFEDEGDKIAMDKLMKGGKKHKKGGKKHKKGGKKRNKTKKKRKKLTKK